MISWFWGVKRFNPIHLHSFFCKHQLDFPAISSNIEVSRRLCTLALIRKIDYVFSRFVFWMSFECISIEQFPQRNFLFLLVARGKMGRKPKLMRFDCAYVWNDKIFSLYSVNMRWLFLGNLKLIFWSELEIFFCFIFVKIKRASIQILKQNNGGVSCPCSIQQFVWHLEVDCKEVAALLLRVK